MIPVYEHVQRKPNVMRNRNPLKQSTSKIVKLADRIAELQGYKEWQKLIAEYQKKGVRLDPKLRPLIQNVKLKFLLIDEDIQRLLDAKHCAKDIAAIDRFDPRLLQVIYCIKIPGKNEYHAVDGQHTATTLAALVDAQLFDNETDWREVEVPVLYIETDSKAFARKAFALINGKGKKKISPWYEHRCRVMARRIDGSDEEEDIEAEEKQTICETHDCYPVDKPSAFQNLPGTFTHMEALGMNRATLEFCCKWHNQYFHYDPINGSLWFMMSDIKKEFDAAHIKITDKFLEELAGIIQGYFAGLAQYHDAVHVAHLEWSRKKYKYEVPWQDKCIAYVLIQLYKKLGGEQEVPEIMLDEFKNIMDFFAQDIKDLFVETA
jgi:hypothetical protein